VRCGLKNRRNDLGLIVADTDASAAAVFTQNHFRAACVDVSREAVAGGRLRGLVVNSGNANCATGESGRRDSLAMAELARRELRLPGAAIAVASTGIIGHPLDMLKVESGIRDAAIKLGDNPAPFVEAILTTDLVEKVAEAELGPARILGIAKGSGMIAPQMATMLAFVVTDAVAEPEQLAAIWRRVNARTLNSLTVDGDTSTNDMAFVLAGGASGYRPSDDELEQALATVADQLARQIARDGEGATKLMVVRVTGSRDPWRIARTIAESPLVKTAMFGCDPNWGRILMAAGRAGVPFDPNHAYLAIEAGGQRFEIFADGVGMPFDAAQVSAGLKNEEICLDLRLGPGETAQIYGCDLGYGYVRINAEYHT
jgi:glutamate N-acetyltransferase/amino-acid N-acetyltransferase